MQRKSFLYLFAFAFLALWVAMVPKGAAAQPAVPTAPGDCSPDTSVNILYQNGFGPGEIPWTSSGIGSTWIIDGGHYHATAPATVSDQRLVSPPVTLPSGQDPIVFKFWHRPNLEFDGPTTCYDGGILEVSTDGGLTFAAVFNAYLLTGPYRGLVSPDYWNPLGGLSGWCGVTGEPINTIADLSAYAGETVQFRLRLGTDTSVDTPGWDVDDVTVQSCLPANIDVSPLSISSAQATNTTTSQTLTVANVASGTLNWQIAEEPADLPQTANLRLASQPTVTCDNPADVGWLSVSPTNGSNAGSTNTPTTVTLDSAGLAPGIYNANLCITSNDPDPGPGFGTALVVVPVQLTVEQGCISGRVFANDINHPMQSAYVQVCRASGSCVVTQTDGSGQYSVCGLGAGQHDVTAFPSPSWDVQPATLGSITLPANTTLSNQDLTLVGPIPLLTGTTITSIGTGSNGVPIVSWAGDLTLTTLGCTGGGVSYDIIHNGVPVSDGWMAEGPGGFFTAVIPQLSPVHGYATVIMTLICPSGTTTNSFDIYIDPSGHVLTTTGAPIGGATVTLYRSDGPGGPFAAVPDGSGMMAPENRTNPDTTDAAGRFGWNVLAGYYIVRAEATGCHAPGNPGQPYAESPVLTIPPPVTDLELRLDCTPLAVTLAEFEAVPGDGGVQIAWETVAETDLQGFHLWRSLSPSEPAERLTQAMIPAQSPGSSQGASYRYDDTSIEVGQTYWYWLEDVDVSGATTLHGPVSAMIGAPTAVTLSSLGAAESSPLPAPVSSLPPGSLPVVAGLALGAAAWWRRKR